MAVAIRSGIPAELRLEAVAKSSRLDLLENFFLMGELLAR